MQIQCGAGGYEALILNGRHVRHRYALYLTFHSHWVEDVGKALEESVALSRTGA